MERAFNFKLLVPPRPRLGLGGTAQVSAVKPQDPVLYEDNSSFTAPVQTFNKCFENELISSITMPFPTECPRPEVTKMSAVMPIEKEEPPLRASQLYSKLFEEAEKIKAWKLKMDYNISQKDRALQENRRTVETQRKAIQELQFENESLSMKLEEQLNENEDMRNKNNTTRNLCNILKDTFERSAEKMSLFEAEREETHGLFLQNHENVQGMIAAFESLRLQAEADQLEMLKAKEGLKQFEELKVRFENDYHMKEEMVFLLEEKQREKEGQLIEISLKLQEAQINFSKLQDSSNQHLWNCEQQQNALKEKLENEEQLRLESEEKQKSLVNTVEQTKEMYERKLLEKDIKLKEINCNKEQLARQIEEIQLTAESSQSSLKSEKMRVQELESKLSSVSQELCIKNKEMGIIREKKMECDSQLQALKCEMETMENALKSFDEKMKADELKILQLASEPEEKNKEINTLKEKLEIAAVENKNLVASIEDAVNEQKLLKEQCLMKEVKLQAIEGQLSGALEKERESTNNIKKLQSDVSQYKDIYDDLLERFNQLLHQKNTGKHEDTNLNDEHVQEMKETVENLKIEVGKLEMEKQQLQMQLEVLNAKIEEQHQENENIQKQLKETNKSSQNRLAKKEKQVKALELKLSNLKTKLETKAKTQDEKLKEIAQLKEESQRLKHCHQEENKRISSELENKLASEAELTLEVQKWTQASLEATKSKEDAELKFQQKISDMVALMERHKHEYDKMVEEKDTELNEKRMREAEINANKTSLELELSYLQVENVQLKQRLDVMKMEGKNQQQQVEELATMQTSQKDYYKKKEECLEQEIIALKEQIESLEKDKAQKLSETPSNKKGSETPHVASSKKSTPALSTKTGFETPLRKDPATPFRLDDSLKTPSWTLGSKTGTTSRIRSFRIRTPPSTEKSAPWKKNTLELDPKSDSSEQNDVLSFSTVNKKKKKDSKAEGLGLFNKVQGSAVYKSPGAALKLAAMKRMRDAGWTTITSSDKKKKKATEKIFA